MLVQTALARAGRQTNDMRAGCLKRLSRWEGFMPAKRFTAFLCRGVKQERDMLTELGRQRKSRRQPFLRELLALGLADAQNKPPAVAVSGDQCDL